MTHPIVPVRGVHLDLKGLPPNPQRLLELLDVFAAARFNAVLVEWEDAFPWEMDRQFRSETFYSRAQVDAFHDKTRALGLQIIPLVQCLGHMETPLRLDAYAHLREIPDRCESLNPLAPGARELVERMVDEVVKASGPITHFHLGGDEAFTFGSHPDTRAYIEKHGKGALYLHHVEPLIDNLLSRGIRPILWHDMMHDWDAASLARLKDKADLMVWWYHGHPDQARESHSTRVIERFHDAGLALWGAAAYKGADSSGDADLPDLAKRVANARGWAEVASRFNMNGVIATAWSRYTTQRVQCEPIDGALDVMLQVANVLFDGAPLDEEACAAQLKAMGQWEKFSACRATLSRLSESRRSCWEYILLARQQSAVERLDPRRRGSGMRAELLRIANDHSRAAESAGEEVRRAFNGLIEDHWMRLYVAERIEPLREGLASL